MNEVAPEFEELRVCLDRVRALLENLVVRGLRACGPDELAQLRSFAQDLEQSGAAHVSSALAELNEEIDRGERTAARTLLTAQTSVRLLERLLTLRVVKDQFCFALEASKIDEGASSSPSPSGRGLG